VVRLRLPTRVGDLVDVRRNVGKNIGHVLLRAPDRETLLRAIAEVDDTLRIEIEPA